MRLKVPLSSISALVMDQGCSLGLSGERIWLLPAAGWQVTVSSIHLEWSLTKPISGLLLGPSHEWWLWPTRVTGWALAAAPGTLSPMSGSANRPVVCKRNRRQSAGGGWGLSWTWLKFKWSSSFFFSQQSADFLSSPPLKEARQVSGSRSAPALLKPGLGRGAAPQGPFPPDC